MDGGAAMRGTYALVIIPPPDAWGPFVAIKKNHMNPRIRRPPYPHITLLGKFNDRQVSMAKRAVAECEPFNLRIEEFKVFTNPRNCTVYLDPVEEVEVEVAGAAAAAPAAANDPHRCMRRVHESLRRAGFQTSDFEPHIGVCFCDRRAQADELVEKYQKEFPPIRFRVTHLYVMKRVGEEDPFEPWAAIPLKGQEQTQLQHILVEK